MKSKKKASSPRKELVLQEFLAKAAELFEQKGFSQTTIQDIALALDLSRSSVYHYFKSKEEILEALVQEDASVVGEYVATADTRPRGSARDVLQALLTHLIHRRLTGGARLRVLDKLAVEMPPPIRQKFDQTRRRVLDLYAKVISQGIDRGELRPVDARIAALSILGIANWTSWWYSPTGRKSPEELSEILVDIAFHGVVQPVGRSNGTQKVQNLIRSLKQDISLLEKVIGSAP
ncbi:TetR family transcriptional regulator [Bradyrhizobium sp. BRP22]|uniref:TetR/AcrR family transcriptional regulator n=1 Tax=Bradyrhizobium sp. BRP22 TaxID=2793821 RepID=UPI001CD4537A|nr:TetR/AcrR family transcriptional regulator [Bradyrhizobium sp. BRP22]MCA1457081.1 TetR family transcriptional regulator [Bradyrhizobium sp. BRP22]